MVAWVAMPVSAIALAEVVWWKWEDAASTPPDGTTVDSGVAVEVAGGVTHP